MDGMSDHEHKPWVDNHPPTAEEREVHEYPLNLTTVRQKLGTQQGKKYWRTLDELAADPISRICCTGNIPAAQQSGMSRWIAATF